MTHIALIAALWAAQEDPIRILTDRAKRSDSVARKKAAEECRAKAADSPMHAIAARYLEKSEYDWKTDPKDPASAALDGVFQKFWTGDWLDERKHREALDALQTAIEKTPGSPAIDALRLIQLAHLSCLGDAAAETFKKLGWKREMERWGKPEQIVLLKITKHLESAGDVPSDVHKAARVAPHFAPRYVAAVLDVQRAFVANQNFENAGRSIAGVKTEGAPPSLAPHLKAMFDSIKAAVHCRQCEDGKLLCDQCNGKKKLDLTCENCHGLGWSQKPNSYANVLQKCPNCKGNQIFKNQNCPTCRATGKMACRVCGGKPWRDGFKGCVQCKACDTCKGKRETSTVCSTCNGKGRSGGVNPQLQIPTILCDGCKGEAILREACKACGQSGLADCEGCGGKGPRKANKASITDVWTSVPCGACAGSGWPLRNLAYPCEKCYGLGSRLQPKADPKKVLE